MLLRFLMDVHVPNAITAGLRRDGVDVVTAQEDGSAELDDPALLDRAAALGRVLVSFDRDHLVECRRRMLAGVSFSGLVHARPTRITIGQAVADLQFIADVCEPADAANQVFFIPL